MLFAFNFLPHHIFLIIPFGVIGHLMSVYCLRYPNTHPVINLNIGGSLSCHKRYQKSHGILNFQHLRNFSSVVSSPFPINNFFKFHHCTMYAKRSKSEMPAIFSEVYTMQLGDCRNGNSLI